MHESVFRKYDIRGKVGLELVLDEVYELGLAIISYLTKKNPSLKQIVIGMDGRTHSPMIKEELVSACMDAGLQVTFIGVVPTPVLYFSQYLLPVDAGIMVTASHNPKEYNGLKIVLNGASLWGDDIMAIRDSFYTRPHLFVRSRGTYQYIDIKKDYISYIGRLFPHLKEYDKMLVFDCGNGAVGAILKELIKHMAWKNTLVLYDDIDGNYPNHEADPIIEKNMLDMRDAVLKNGAVCGFGFDGDGDRMACITDQGELVIGDKLLGVFAEPILLSNVGASVVFDIKCSLGLRECIEKLGGMSHRSPSGHALIKKNMKEYKALVGGELSCHFFFQDRYFGYDDGIYAALRMIERLQQSGKTLHELLTFFPRKVNSPEFRIDCHEGEALKIVDGVYQAFSRRPDVSINTIDGVCVETEDGWGLIRSSNTQPVVCLRFEADSDEGLKKLKAEFAQVLESYLSSEKMVEYFQ